MIKKPIQYDVLEQGLIKLEMSKNTFNSESWSDSVFSDIRSKIKTHYISIQKNKCPYCQQKTLSNHGRYWDIEHIIARATIVNFMFEPENLCISCIDCNQKKGKKKITSSKAKVHLPSSSSSYLIIHPHYDNYEEHIMVIKEGFYYIALKEKGEKTIEVCGLNRFYEFADYSEDVADDDRIFLLAEQLATTTDIEKKKAIRNELAYLAIQGNQCGTR
ncbi:MAG: HNH endonuclease [Arcobacter sp.]|nr:MAG: HNH endonuclease [Arcobacter sp.]